jgi:hypothetical protein
MTKSSAAQREARRNERGSSTVKFIIVLAVVSILIYMGIQYVPVAYNYRNFKTYMQESVDTGAVTGQGTEWVRSRLQANAKDYGVPSDAKINTGVQDGRMTATVQFTRPINLLPGIWTYTYPFDYTVKSTDLFSSGK